VSQDLTYTLLGLGVCGFLGAYGFMRHFRKTNALKAPLIPWMIVSLGCIATAFMLVVHLVNLLGFETGR
jgi:hypothetical protein